VLRVFARTEEESLAISARQILEINKRVQRQNNAPEDFPLFIREGYNMTLLVDGYVQEKSGLITKVRRGCMYFVLLGVMERVRRPRADAASPPLSLPLFPSFFSSPLASHNTYLYALHVSFIAYRTTPRALARSPLTGRRWCSSTLRTTSRGARSTAGENGWGAARVDSSRSFFHTSSK
jgi:hypothetical protein